ncbi:MAG: methyltransferase [Gammaproteobacteria bacterium]|nr:methyltransferase [Gammaproteobacteria bacterium]
MMQEIIDICAEKWHQDQVEARRLFHGRGHFYPGYENIVVNWFPPFLHIAVYGEVNQPFLEKLHQALLEENKKVQGSVVQFRDGRRTQTQVWFGEVPDEHVVLEGGLQYLIAPMRNQNVGLFLDMAHVRKWLIDKMQDATVLNLFAYTCAFSVSAIEHGARMVVNNDMSKPSLEVGNRNHLLNQHDLRKVRMLPHNLFKSWWKVRQLGPYDIVIIDPPTNQKGSFVAEKSYSQILKRIPEFTKPGGTVLACLNSPFLGPDFLHNQMARWCPRARFVEMLPPHIDFPDRYPERGLKVLAFTFS